MLRDSNAWDELYKKQRGACQSPYTIYLHRKIREIIPEDCRSILDAGCGGGALMIALAKDCKYTIEGVDQSSEGVRFIVNELNMKAQVADITDLRQYPDDSFDMVICSEVLEHLPRKVLVNAVKELSRVAKKYLLITNPYREKLDYHQLTCEHCFTRYHPAGHIHSIDESFMRSATAPYAENTSFFYSGVRDCCSSLYAAFLRSFGYSLINLETSCPICGMEVPFKRWNVSVRVVGKIYRVTQKILKLFGIWKPANIITFLKVK